jgi:DNA/RNA-binding domain of Phe-tRNA-synthetase-like protein
MKAIGLTSEFRDCNEIELRCIECDVVYLALNQNLWRLMEEQAELVSGKLSMEEISKIPAIAASRAFYKKCGKDPARYRLSAEALLRRMVKGAGLYQPNNIVDQLNLVSITTGYSIGGYDAGKIQGQITFGTGKTNEPYIGIGRGELNIEGMPVFRDSLGAFGTPTSDSERTLVTPEIKRFLMIIVGLGANERLNEASELAESLLKEFCGGTNFEFQTIK